MGDSTGDIGFNQKRFQEPFEGGSHDHARTARSLYKDPKGATRVVETLKPRRFWFDVRAFFVCRVGPFVSCRDVVEAIPLK